MRYFYLDKIYAVDEGQYTADEIANQESPATACAPSGAVDVTDYAEDIKAYSGTHTASLVDGVLVWTEKVAALSAQQQIYALEASISARRWREAYLGDEEAKLFISDVNFQIEVLRESL